MRVSKFCKTARWSGWIRICRLPVPLDELIIAPKYDELIAALEWCEFRSLLAEVRAEAKGVQAGKPAAVQDESVSFLNR